MVVKLTVMCLVGFYVTLAVESTTTCHHEAEDPSHIVSRVFLQPKRRVPRRAQSAKSLRIRVHFDASIKSQKAFHYIKRCRYIRNGSYYLSGSQGREIEDTNFLLYISSFLTDRCDASRVLAYAAHCQIASNTDRPIAGYINFCPDALGQNSDHVRSLFIAKHELLHALGFSTSLFAFYRDKNGRPLTSRDPNTQLPSLGLTRIGSHAVYRWSDRVVREVDRRWLSAYGNQTKRAHIVVMPTVLRVARAFFDCPTLDGVELEDQDEAGVFLTHWEKRLLENELMTATYTNSYRVSPVTLAMMEDTGWYLANYAMSQDFSWGHGLGCSFAMASCLEYMLEQRSRRRLVNPFCQQLQAPLNRTDELGVQVSCTPDQVSYGFCNLITHRQPLPKEYVYFVRRRRRLNQGMQNLLESRVLDLGGPLMSDEDATPLDYVGGKIALANYCPYHQEIEWERARNQPTVNTHCHAINNFKEPKKNFKLERFTPKSICVQHSPDWRLSNGENAFAVAVEGAGCYTFRCSRAEGGLVIELEGGMAIPCVTPGSLIHVKACLASQGFSVDGHLICPDCRLLCDPRECPHMRADFVIPWILRPALAFRKFMRDQFQTGTHNLPKESTFQLFNKALVPHAMSVRSRHVEKQEIIPGYCPRQHNAAAERKILDRPNRLFIIVFSVNWLILFNVI